jgi:flagellar biogenesis protein FliO
MRLFFALVVTFMSLGAMPLGAMPLGAQTTAYASLPLIAQAQNGKKETKTKTSKEQPTPSQEQQAPTTQPLPEEKSSAEPEEMPITYRGAFLKMMLTLLALIVLIVISVWMLRRIGQGRFRQMSQGRQIRILERRPLSAKSVLYVVEVGRKKVLIAESQLEVRSIASVDEIYPTED